jgi:RNA polymerase sigma-70 factor (ECF subfamily)
MKPTDEQDLLKGIQAFDLPSLAAAYDQYSPGLYRYAMRLLGDDLQAEDCVAETFARLLKALRAGHGPTQHLRAYLYRMAHNWITDQYRRGPPPELELHADLPGGEGDDPTRQAELSLERRRVRAALSRLTDDQRQVISLRFLEGWENEEVAAALRKPVGAVKALQHRAVAALRRLLLTEESEEAYEEDGHGNRSRAGTPA